MLNGFVELVLGMNRTPLAAIISGCAGHGEQETRSEYDHRQYLSQR
jgi:hypothetical protein